MPDLRPDDRLDEHVRASYRASQPRDAAAEARVLERLSTPRHARPGWWFESHLFELRPAAFAVLAVTALGAALWAGTRLSPRPVADANAPPGVTPAPHTAATAGLPVTFVLHTAEASRVNLVGDFNSWDPDATPLRHDGSRDLWLVELRLPQGVHNYAFVLDGREWRPDPAAPLAADASFGGRNSVVVVGGGNGL